METQTRGVRKAGPGWRAGPAAAILSALLFGATTPIAKYFLEDARPLLIAGLLYLGSGIGLTAMRVIQDRRWNPSGLQRADYPWLAGATITGGMLAPALLMLGLVRSDAATASLLLNMEAVFSALIAWLLFREATSRRVVLGFFAIFAGCALLSWPSKLVLTGAPLGPLCVVAACFFWGLDNNLTRNISAADSRIIAAIKGLIAGATNTVLAVSMGATFPAAPRLAGALTLGFLGYGLSLVLFIVSLRNLGTARTGAYFALSPFIGTALAVMVYQEPITAAFYLASALMAVGVWLHVTEHHAHEHEHGPMTHTHEHTHDAHHQHEHAPQLDPESHPTEPHTHAHSHGFLRHSHAHFPDIHHGHRHD
jgi:drug/metabolite transporter (DMT)-like permease